MTRFAVSGYASLDHALAVDATPRPDRTVLVRGRLSHSWPSHGGCGPYVARALARAGRQVTLLSWLGDDDAGRDYLEALRRDGVDVAGVIVQPGAPTASTWLLYDPDGGTTCLYDPGGRVPEGLGEAQRAALAAADWTVLTVGPQPVNRALLDTLAPGARLAFAVKADPDAFPPDVVGASLERAALVAFSRAERAFLEEAAGGDVLGAAARRGVAIETRGRDGVLVTAGGATRHLPVEAVPARDTTGAGDTLLGATLARLADLPDWPPGLDAVTGAVADGMTAARSLLRAKTPMQRTSG